MRGISMVDFPLHFERDSVWAQKEWLKLSRVSLVFWYSVIPIEENCDKGSEKESGLSLNGDRLTFAITMFMRLRFLGQNSAN